MANLFVPFEVRNKVEEIRRRLEGRIRGVYNGPPAGVALFEQVDQDLLDILEMIDLILRTADIDTQAP